MSLLREIQSAAIDSTVDLASLLRKCKVLAARLGNPEFKQWVDDELNGYKGRTDLPSYRISAVNSKGHFSGPFGSGVRNADIPLLCVPEEFREVLGHSYLSESVAALQSLVVNCKNGMAQEPWNPDLVLLFAEKFYTNMRCVQAWKQIPMSQVVGALDAVRTKVLSFVMEIESENPDAGDAPINSSPIAQEKVNQIFHTHIYGTVQNVATGSSDFAQTANLSGDNTSIFKELQNAVNSLNDSSITALVSPSIENMREAQGTKNFKQHYQNFMSILSDHMQVLGPLVAPYLPGLAAILS